MDDHRRLQELRKLQEESYKQSYDLTNPEDFSADLTQLNRGNEIRRLEEKIFPRTDSSIWDHP